MLKNVKNMSAAIKHYADTTPNKIYVIFKEKNYTYSQINNMIDQVCSLYKSLELKKGDIISAVIQNSVEYVLFYMAALRYGCVFNPYPHSLEAKDIVRYLDNIQPQILFCQSKHYDDLRNKELNLFLIKDDFIQGLKKKVDPYPDFVPKEKSPACIYYSSGTTGNPKSVVFSYKNMIANISSIIRGFRFTSNTTHLIILPLGHTASVNYSYLPCTLAGGTMVITESFWKARADFWKLIKKYKINYVEVVPSVLVALLNTPYEKEEYEDITSLKYIGCGSSILPKEVQLKFMEKYGIKVANLYGLSETGPTHIDYPLGLVWKPGSVGKPLDVNEVRIVNEKGSVLKPGEVGEIIIKGDNVFIDYYKNHKRYKEVVKNGFFYTGDLGYMTEDDSLFFMGRKKEVIIKGGINIYPDEIDEILYKLDSVKNAATVGVTDEYLGEKIVSYIVTDVKDKELILNHCKKFLSDVKIPDEIKFVKSIPKSPVGKLLRRKLK